MESQIGIGVIGCGKLGISIARKVVAQDPRLKVVAVFDPDPSASAGAKAVFEQAPAVHADFRTLVADPAVQWVMIASWNCQHADQAIAALEAGKHVFCQKPLAISTEECECILRAAQRSKTLFAIGFTLRYSPHYRTIKRLLDEGAVGRIISLEFNETLDFNHGAFIMGDWRRFRDNAGTHLLEKCCHDIDVVNWMVGARAKRVASFGGLNFFRPENAYHIERLGKRDDGKVPYGTWLNRTFLNPFTSEKDIVDNQVAILEYDNAVRATFHTNLNAGIPERRLYILGTEGAIRSDVLKGEIQVKRIGFDTALADHSTGARGGHGGGDDVLAREIADSMLLHTPPAAGLMTGIESAVTCFAIDQAMDTGTVIDVGSFWARFV